MSTSSKVSRKTIQETERVEEEDEVILSDVTSHKSEAKLEKKKIKKKPSRRRSKEPDLRRLSVFSQQHMEIILRRNLRLNIKKQDAAI